MKSVIYLSIVFSICFFSCKKKSNSINDIKNSIDLNNTNNIDTNNNINILGLPVQSLVFEKLDVKDTIAKVQAKILIKAIASGDHLTYAWSGDYISPSDSSSVIFQICHAARTKIKCIITDIHNNSATKEIYMTSKEL